MNNSGIFKTIKNICLGLGILLFLSAFISAPAEQAAAAGMACFMGIVSRICQAE